LWDLATNYLEEFWLLQELHYELAS
jgi:hypothetical protein